MSNKMNPWAISTFVLLGIVVGFGVAQFSGGLDLFRPKVPTAAADYFVQYAKELKLDKKDFKKCLESGQHEADVKADFNDGVKYNVQGTPAFFVNGHSIDGAQPYQVFQNMFDGLLAGKNPDAPTEDKKAADSKAKPGEKETPPVLTEEDYKKISDDVSSKGVSEGDANAPIVIVEFADFQCPYCGRFFDQTLSQIRENYIKTGKVRMIYRHFPLSFHPHAEKAAEASVCAQDQGKFWEMHDKIFQGQKDWSAMTKTTDSK